MANEVTPETERSKVAVAYWAISDDSPRRDPDAAPGLSFSGIFTSPERAIDHLRHIALGAEIVDRFHWYRSPRNSGYISGYWHDVEKDREHYYHIIRCAPDEEWPGDHPDVYDAGALLTSLPEMHDEQFPADGAGGDDGGD